MLHVAIIMDGNGRWATQRGLPRLTGHAQGAQALIRTVEAAATAGVTDLTVYAFSSDNWRRPETETTGLMHLLARFLDAETERCRRQGIRLEAIGRRDRLPAFALAALERAENATAGGSRLTLRIALDYSSRDSIVSAARQGAACRDAFSQIPNVDLLIRTAGEQRLSDFLLWECAYAEFWFTPTLWPDFSEVHLHAALDAFSHRVRRFGALPEQAA